MTSYMNQKELLTRVHRLLPSTGNYTYYQQYKRVGLQGQRPVEKRWAKYNVEKYINQDSVVLDLGCNIGCMSLHIADKVRAVHGIEKFENYIKAANLIKEYLQISNCFFYHGDFMAEDLPYYYDFVMALAVHYTNLKSFHALVLKVLSTLKVGGHLLFEERKPKQPIPYDQLIGYMMTMGLNEVCRGECRFTSGNNKVNHLRNFSILERIK